MFYNSENRPAPPGVGGAAAGAAPEERLDLVRAVLENDSLGIAVIEQTGDVAVFNAAAERMTGLERSDVAGRPLPAGLLREEDAAAVAEAMAQGRRVDSREIQLRRKGGGIKDVILSAAPLSGAAGGQVYFFVDNTEKKYVQNMLVRSQRMDIVSEMAGGIAHDFNNLLEGILGYSSFMIDLVGEGHELRSYLEIIERSTRRASELTERLLTLSRYGESGGHRVDCNTLLQEVVKILDRSLDRQTVVELDLEDRLAPVQGAAGALETALLNVCLNARDAMPGGGTIGIKSENLVIDETYPRLDWNMEPGPYVRISISDNGQGMDKATRERIFEPFFTTKKRGEGAGLGLTLVYGIVKNHGGFINVYSEPGRGSIFNIYLPAEEAAAQQNEEPVRGIGGAPRGGGELVLVVEDDQMVRDLTQNLLETLGYRVVTAGNAGAGAEIFSERGGEIDLVLLDFVIPGGGGEVFGRLREQRRDVPVILTSGYNRSFVDPDLLGSASVSFVQKPYSMDDLARVVHACLHPPALGSS